jgi:hypothetical protein
MSNLMEGMSTCVGLFVFGFISDLRKSIKFGFRLGSFCDHNFAAAAFDGSFDCGLRFVIRHNHFGKGNGTA